MSAIFFRKDRCELLTHETCFNKENKTIECARIKDLKTGATWVILNSHLAFFDIEERAQMAKTMTYMATNYQAKYPVIIAGDFNSFANRPGLTPILPALDGNWLASLFRSSGFENAMDVSLLGHFGPIGTFTSDPNNRSFTKPFTGQGTPGIMLDHILVSNRITVLSHAVDPALVDKDFPSDHMPVIADLISDHK